MNKKSNRLWQQLLGINQLRFIAESETKGIGWNGSGAGQVRVDTKSDDEIHFVETGNWQTESGKQLNFSNTYRWQKRDKPDDQILLSHLRYGKDHPVELLTLSETRSGIWQPFNSHRCNADQYTLDIKLQDFEIEMRWRIMGPKKNQTLLYIYC